MEAVTLFDFASSVNDELSFRKGDLLIILRANMERNWSKALLCQKVGLVPKTYIRLKPIPGFMGTISRANAEEVLAKVGINNSFLFRESETSPGDFSISVWHQGKARHYIILQDKERLFWITEKRLNTLNSSIAFHKNNSIIQAENIKLVHPVPDSLVFSVAVSFTARDQSELTIKKGSKATVVDYSDKNWWVGICEDQKGMFPVQFLKPVDYPTLYEED